MSNFICKAIRAAIIPKMMTAPVATQRALNDVARIAFTAAVIIVKAFHAAMAALVKTTAAAMPPMTAPRVTTNGTLLLIHVPIA